MGEGGAGGMAFYHWYGINTGGYVRVDEAAMCLRFVSEREADSIRRSGHHDRKGMKL